MFAGKPYLHTQLVNVIRITTITLHVYAKTKNLAVWTYTEIEET